MDEKKPEDYIREYAPYESSIAFLSGKLHRKDKVQFSFVIRGSGDFRAAQALEQELIAWKKAKLTLTLTKAGLHTDPAEQTQWRLSGISAPRKLPSEKAYFKFIGRLWDMTAHYEGRLETCTLRLND